MTTQPEPGQPDRCRHGVRWLHECKDCLHEPIPSPAVAGETGAPDDVLRTLDPIGNPMMTCLKMEEYVRLLHRRLMTVQSERDATLRDLKEEKGVSEKLKSAWTVERDRLTADRDSLRQQLEELKKQCCYCGKPVIHAIEKGQHEDGRVFHSTCWSRIDIMALNEARAARNEGREG